MCFRQGAAPALVLLLFWWSYGVSRMHWKFSQNPTTVWVGKDLVGGSFASNPLPWAGIQLLDQAACPALEF